MKDEIIRLTVADGQAVAFIARSTETVESARKIHNSSPVVTAALGRLLTAGAMMGQMLDDESHKLNILIRGDGPVESLLITANNQGQVKGFAMKPQVEVPNKANGKHDVAGIIGKGRLTVIKDSGSGEPFAGTVELFTSEIAEDIAYYYVQSEQTPSAVALGVHVARDYTVEASGGFLIQLLPDADPNLAQKIEEKVIAAGPVSELYRQGESPETIAEMLFSEIGYTIHESTPMEFYCSCSEDKLRSVLISLGRDELTQMLEEDGKAEVLCHFCDTAYFFGKDQLSDMLKAQ